MSEKEKKPKNKSIQTPEFRVSYPHVFEPQTMPGSKPKYSVVMLFSKDQDLSVIKKALRDAKINAFGPDKSDWPSNLESPIDDGDDPAFADRLGYKGHWAIKASCNAQFGKPSVVSSEKDDDGKWVALEDSTDFYPGCYARASIFPKVWTFMKKQGVMFVLDGVQKLRDGKAFGGKKSPEQAFGPLAGADEDDETTESFL